VTVDRATVLERMAAAHADWLIRVVRHLGAGRYGVPVDDLTQGVWEKLSRARFDLPTEHDHQRALLRTCAEWAFKDWLAGAFYQRDVRTYAISDLAERRRGGERWNDPDDVVIGLAYRETVEQVVLAREQLRVVRAAIAEMTPLERLGLAHAMGMTTGSPARAAGARRRLIAALEHAGYAFRYGSGKPYSRVDPIYRAAYNRRPEVRERRRERYERIERPQRERLRAEASA
jgi:hypothetical protein